MNLLAKTLPYNSHHEFHFKVGDRNIRYFSKPGLPHWDRITPSARLLARHTQMAHKGHAILMGVGNGAWGVALALQSPGVSFTFLDHSIIAHQMTSLTLKANRLPNASTHSGISVLPGRARDFQCAAMDIPKGRSLARRWLLETYYALENGGTLYLSGANKMGVKSLARDGQALFGNATILAYKKGNRVVLFKKTIQNHELPDWSREPGLAPGTWRELEIEIPGGPHHLYNLPGIFSGDGLDEGTRLLLDHIKISPQERVLDLGCGYGIIGIFAALSGAAHVDLVDSNLLAIAAAAKNLESYQIDHGRALPSDALSAVRDQRYSMVLTNPPVHTGTEVDYQVTTTFIRGSWQALEPGGRLILVSNQFIRYGKIMKDIFGNIRTIIQDGRFHLLEAVKK